MAYFVWLIEGDDGNYLLDTGFEPEAAERGGRHRVIDADISETLDGLGAPPEGISSVFLSHLHFDHIGGLERFPNAKFWVQDKEVAFWTGRHLSQRSFRAMAAVGDLQLLLELNHSGRVRFVDGDAAVAPGLSLHRVGGHTPGSQAVSIDTGHQRIVLAADAAHYLANLERDVPYSRHESVAGVHDSFERLRVLAGEGGHVVAGHDPLVMTLYPALEGREGIVADLTRGPLS